VVGPVIKEVFVSFAEVKLLEEELVVEEAEEGIVVVETVLVLDLLEVIAPGT
jgi:hypothetical protein